MVVADEWKHPYSREKAAFPLECKATYTNFNAAVNAAIESVAAIATSYGTAASKMLAVALAARQEQVPATVFEAALITICDTASGVSVVAVRGYVSNARRIYAASAENFAKAVETAGDTDFRALAAACPKITNRGKKAAPKGAEVTTGDSAAKKVVPKVPTPYAKAQAVLELSVAVEAVRGMFEGSTDILKIIAELSDAVEEIRDIACRDGQVAKALMAA